jgi:ADP-heptose:LPS heptosyltransferase
MPASTPSKSRQPTGLPVRVSILQKWDCWVFVPICFLLTLTRRLADLVRPIRSEGEIRSILFVKLAEQGSTVLAASAIRRAVARVGKENVYFAAFEENRFILDAMGLIPARNVMTVPTTSLFAMCSGTLRMLIRMRAIGFDAAVDMEFMARFSAAITYLSGARMRAGLHGYFHEGPYRGDLMTHRVLFNPYLHTSEMFQVLVEALERPAGAFPAFDLHVEAEDTLTPVFHPVPAEVAELDTILRPFMGATPRVPLILLNPNASDFLPLRRWPLERYCLLAQALLERYPDIHVAVTGLPSEEAASSALVQKVANVRCFSLAGKTTLRQLLVLYTRARVLVTNDSGPAHFAVLTPMHVVTLFGPESPRLFAARCARNRVVHAGIACSPCVNAYNNRQSACRDNLCMQAITVEDVLEQIVLAYSDSSAQTPPPKP